MSKNVIPTGRSEIASAIKQICEEKNIPYESVIETINQALAAAYRKDFGEKNQNLKAEFNPETGKTRVFDVKTVVEDLPEEEIEELIKEKPRDEGKSKETKKLPARNALHSKAGGETKKQRDEEKEEKNGSGKEEPDDVESNKETREKKKALKADEPKKIDESEKSNEEDKPKFNPRTDIQLSAAKALKKVNSRIHSGVVKVGDEIKTELKIPAEFGRMAAQTAKQVIIQRLREAERDVLYKEFKNKEGQVLIGIVQRREGRLVLIDLGTTTALIPPDQQIETENYNSGQRYRVYISEVRETSKGPEIIVSRTHPEIVKQLFTVEVPEIASGTVEIKALSREAGSRSKVAVCTTDDSIDPIGACVGQRGTRIQTIITELGGEKIDIIQYNEDLSRFIANALSPAKVIAVKLSQEEKTARVKVRPDQLSLAIGKAGQNVRLAAKLTGWKIDIEEAVAPGAKSDDESQEIKKSRNQEIKNEESGEKEGGGKEKLDEDKKSAEKAELEETKKIPLGPKLESEGETKKLDDEEEEDKEDIESKSVNKETSNKEIKDEPEKASEAKPHTKTEASGAGEEKIDEVNKVNKKEEDKK